MEENSSNIDSLSTAGDVYYDSLGLDRLYLLCVSSLYIPVPFNQSGKELIDILNVWRGDEHVAKEEKMVDVSIALSGTPKFPEDGWMKLLGARC